MRADRLDDRHFEQANVHAPAAFAQLEVLRFGRMSEATVTLVEHTIGRPVGLPGEDGVANMRAIEAVVESARTGGPIDVAGAAP